ncbi:hypothetical protein BKA69DRAFT_832816 [Paraphysoderma sedebokerense]|nr:hypothetical protein BKA69DRAFT_832816 [Paraphysoderma sedebokerense]
MMEPLFYLIQIKSVDINSSSVDSSKYLSANLPLFFLFISTIPLSAIMVAFNSFNSGILSVLFLSTILLCQFVPSAHSTALPSPVSNPLGTPEQAPQPPGRAPPQELDIQVLERPASCNATQESKVWDTLEAHYQGTLFSDGSIFDSSRGKNPIKFILGAGMVIQGWDQGLQGMCIGERRKLVIPSWLGYGNGGFPPRIPGGASLVFEVELMGIEKPKS